MKKMTASEWSIALSVLKFIIAEIAALAAQGKITRDEEIRLCEIAVQVIATQTPDKEGRWDDLVDDIRAGRETEATAG